MTETKPKRRWFRFSLRTLFVLVTVIGVAAGWLANQLNWIRQRHQTRDWARQHGVEYYFEDTPQSWILRLFREEGIDRMKVRMGKNEDDKGLNALISAYPECKVTVERE
jgi:hypothetical protein